MCVTLFSPLAPATGGAAAGAVALTAATTQIERGGMNNFTYGSKNRVINI